MARTARTAAMKPARACCCGPARRSRIRARIPGSSSCSRMSPRCSTAQRNAAWGEVARRLAHEIKNPLTPIQLSAEQLRRKLLPGLDTEHARLLERATHTIVQQVDAIKQMVECLQRVRPQPRGAAGAPQPQPAGGRDGRAVPPAGSGRRHRHGARSAAAGNRSRPWAGCARSSPTCSATASRPWPASPARRSRCAPAGC